eukprot:6068678-Prymnesium_polylepis.1
MRLVCKSCVHPPCQDIGERWKVGATTVPRMPDRVCPVSRLRAAQPIPTTCDLAFSCVAFQLSGRGGRLPS